MGGGTARIRPRLRWLARGDEHLATVLLAALLVDLGLQVFTRYVLNDPLSWTEEVARHLFVAMVYLGTSAAISDRAHVGINVAVARLPHRARNAVALASNLLVLFFLANMLYWGARATARMWDIPTVTLQLPSGLIYAVLPATATAMIARTLGQMRDDAARLRDGRPASDELRSAT